MNFYNLPYLILVLIYVAIYFYGNSSSQLKNKSNTRFFCALLFILFFGLRGYIGSDWLNYENYYYETSLSSWTVLDYEIGFSFITKLFHDLGFSYQFYVFFLTVLQALLWNRFLKKERQNE